MKIYIVLLLALLARMVWVFMGGQGLGQATQSGRMVPLSSVRSSLAQTYDQILAPMQSNLLLGIVAGGKEIDPKFKTRLTNAGLTHVVAASGMNLTLVCGLLYFLILRLPFRMHFRSLMMGLVILFYMGLTGFDPPIVRAGIMTSVVFLAGWFGRPSGMWWGLVMAAYLMLWVDPMLLVSASFLLSFFATMGQVWLSTRELSLPKWAGGVIEFLAQNLLSSMVAILATLPVIILFFGKVSLIAPLANIMVLWTIEPLMMLGGLIGLVSPVFMPFTQMLAVPTRVLLDYFVWVAQTLGSSDEFVLRVSIDPLFFMVGYYLFLVGFLGLRKKMSP